jgi:CPA2 family monovalent cation:H+ antiporter-2
LAELPLTTEAKYLAHQVVLVGWGRVGKLIGTSLTEQGIPYVVADTNRESVEALRAQGIPAVWGDATEPGVLIQAHIRDARALVIATPDTIQVRTMVETAKTLNPNISVVVRSHNAEEAKRLEEDGAGTVFVGESELAKSMIGFVVRLVDPEEIHS